MSLLVPMRTTNDHSSSQLVAQLLLHLITCVEIPALSLGRWVLQHHAEVLRRVVARHEAQRLAFKPGVFRHACHRPAVLNTPPSRSTNAVVCSAPSTTVVFALLSSSFCHTWLVCCITVHHSTGTGTSAIVNLMPLCHGLLLRRGAAAFASTHSQRSRCRP